MPSPSTAPVNVPVATGFGSPNSRDASAAAAVRAAFAIVTLKSPFPEQLATSLAVTLKANVPAKVGVPVNWPEEPSVSPGGTEPLATKAYGLVPPVAEKVPVYAAPYVPSANVAAGVMTPQNGGAI